MPLALDPIDHVKPPPPPPPAPPPPEAKPSTLASRQTDSCTFSPPQAPSLTQALLAANAPNGFASSAPSTLDLGSSALKGAAVADNTRWFPKGPLMPNAVMVDGNGYRYTSDMFGRPVTASGNLTPNPNPDATRTSIAKTNQKLAGGLDRLPTDQGGHGIGNGFFGRNDAWNLSPQDGQLNHSTYRTMENSWKTTLQGPGGSVQAAVRNVYDEPTLRPTDYVARYSLNGNATKLRVMQNAPNAGFTSSLEGIGRNEATYATLGKISKGLDTFGKVAAPVAVAADGVQLYSAYQQDGGTIGKHTIETGGSVAGGWAGAVAGSELGAEGGAVVGAWFGGVGAVPGAIVGGLVGGAIGGITGSEAGRDIVKLGESAAGAVKDAGKTVVDAGKNVLNFFGL
jgi:hypothetical protein